MAVIEYTNSEGYLTIRLVPDDAEEENYHQGLVLGPPDLSEIPIKEDERKLLSNALARERLLRYPHLSGNRGRLLELAQRAVKSLGAREVRDWIVHVYQKEEYPNRFLEV